MRRKKELKQIDGKEERHEPSSLEQIWGDSGLSKYNTFDVNTYKQNLAEMTKADLQSHAVRVNIIPIDDREQLVKRLVREFNRHVGSFQQPVVKKNEVKPTKEVFKILSEGR